MLVVTHLAVYFLHLSLCIYIVTDCFSVLFKEKEEEILFTAPFYATPQLFACVNVDNNKLLQFHCR